MKTKNVTLFILLFIMLAVTTAGKNKEESRTNEFVVLNLVLADGFLPDEKVKILVVDCKGVEKVVFDNNLDRLNHQDENFFKFYLERGKYNLVEIEFPARQKIEKHGFIMDADVYLELSVNLKNEFLFTTMDSLYGYD